MNLRSEAGAGNLFGFQLRVSIQQLKTVYVLTDKPAIREIDFGEGLITKHMGAL